MEFSGCSHLHGVASVELEQITRVQLAFNADDVELATCRKHVLLVHTRVGLRNKDVAVLVDGDDAFAEVFVTRVLVETRHHVLNLVVPIFLPDSDWAT